ncbi:hypothetical protein Nepgr_028848 [Nepenthes gracilis]|uniref:Secreted protein n=1 Tax=Nepenthes gracilis TaxID=150966 RepID=A0AAD3TB52_NEPGR|nr:hypothetical protein Nepgr_028848 [Nepenthes gracilis]
MMLYQLILAAVFSPKLSSGCMLWPPPKTQQSLSRHAVCACLGPSFSFLASGLLPVFSAVARRFFLRKQCPGSMFWLLHQTSAAVLQLLPSGSLLPAATLLGEYVLVSLPYK